jgi:DNA gyrase subunit A
MGQDFIHKNTLVTIQGNKGSINDPDSFAAMRYTEGKLSKFCEELVKDLKYDTVKMLPSFDGTEIEPEVLPMSFPYFLINSNIGIAVGFITNSVPYNLEEVGNAGIKIIDNEDISNKELLKIVKGPDFPTGGIILGTKGIKEAFINGKSSIKLRCECEIIEAKNEIKIKNIPYLSSKKNLINSIVQAITPDSKTKECKIPEISTVKDYSSKNGVDIRVKVKNGYDCNIVLRKLWKLTLVQSSIKIHYTCICDGKPKDLGFKDAFLYWLNFRIECLINKHKFEYKKTKKQIHLLEAIEKITADPETAIRIIKNSKDSKEAIKGLMTKFELTLLQAKYILEMQVRKFAKYEILKLKEEIKTLKDKLKFHLLRIKNVSIIKDDIKKEISYFIEKFKSSRITKIESSSDKEDHEISELDLIEKKGMTIYLSKNGYIKRVNIDSIASQKRGGKGRKIGIKEDDYINKIINCTSHDEILFSTNLGKIFSLNVYQVPEFDINKIGNNVAGLLNLSDNEKVTTAFIKPKSDNYDLLFLTRQGLIKRTSIKEYNNIRTTGIIAIKLNSKDYVIDCNIVKSESKSEALVTMENGKVVRFPLNEVTPCKRDTIGCRAYYKGGPLAVGLDIISPNDDRHIIILSRDGFGKRILLSEFAVKHRNTKGIIGIRFRNKTDKLIGSVVVDKDNDVIVVSNKKIIKINSIKFKEVLRPALGYRAINLNKGEKVVSIGIS